MYLDLWNIFTDKPDKNTNEEHNFFAVLYSKNLFYVKRIKHNKPQLEGIAIFYFVLKRSLKTLNLPS